MKSESLLKQLAAVFAVVLAVYVLAYAGIEWRRVRSGPWELTFTQEASGTPVIRINQPGLALTNVAIRFPDELFPPGTNSHSLLALAQPRAVPFAVPFGRCVFMDATSLPGTLAFELFGHEIQLLPRALTIDGAEAPWRSGAEFTLSPRRAPAAEKQP